MRSSAPLAPLAGPLFPHARALASFALLALLLASSARAGEDDDGTSGPLSAAQVPAPLKPWIGWALRGHESDLCPATRDRACAWYARLGLDLGAPGGRFAQEVTLFADGKVGLPGGQSGELVWPVEVKADGKPAAVIDEDGAPFVWLPAGAHQLSGSFAWKTMPSSLPIPAETGLVSLKLRGAEVPFPSRDEGSVWLSRESEDERGEDTLTVQTWRLVTDGVPLWMRTRVRLDVSGKSRELVLGGGLLPGFTAVSMSSELPARLEPDGRIRVQVRPGVFSIELTARHDGPADSLALPGKSGAPGSADSGPWAAEGEELWAFDPAPDVREARVSGVAQVDPQQTSLPQEWRSLQTYRVRPGEAMKLFTVRRGDEHAPPDSLSLTRTLWLDFDGAAVTAQDSLSGKLTRSDRLEMAAPSELGRVRVVGNDQLITRLNPGDSPGVELRQGPLSLEAESRIALGGGELPAVLPAVSWAHGVQSLSARLNLPPGWRLLYAGGADEASSGWLKSWSLLDLFALLIAALAVARLLGWGAGLVAFFALGLSLPEGAPKWLWLLPLALEAVSRAVPEGKLRRAFSAARLGALLLLLLALAPFAMRQLRCGLHPALMLDPAYPAEESESGWFARREMALSYPGTAAAPLEVMHAPGPAAAPLSAMSGAAVGGAFDAGGRGMEASKKGLARIAGSGQRDRDVLAADLGDDEPVAAAPARKLPKLQKPAAAEAPPEEGKEVRQQPALDLSRVDPDAVTQTGPGLPTWSWSSVDLSWSGPVEAGAKLRLFLLSPGENMIVAFARVALLAWLWLLLLAPGTPGDSGRRSLKPLFARLRPGAPAAGAALLFACLALPSSARADELPGALPNDQLLEQLRERMTAKSRCGDSCVAMPRLALEASGNSLRLRLELDAAASATAPLPGALGSWAPSSVLLDGKPAAALTRDEEGSLWIALAPGVHQVVLEGALPPRDEIQLALPLKPKQLESQLHGWTLDGVNDDGSPQDALQLARVERSAAKSQRLEPGQLPPFVEVTRTLQLGTTWLVQTQVHRRSPEGSPLSLEVPLLPGESITSADVHAQNGKAQVAMGPHADEVSWTSSLEQVKELHLTASREPAQLEVWRLELAPAWHVEMTGIPRVHAEDEERRVPVFHPWPGESLTLNISRPAPAPGPSITVHQSQLVLSPGARSTDATLQLALLCSRGADTQLELPEGAELQSLALDGRTLPARQEGRKVTLTLSPGEHRAALGWREPRGLSMLFRTSAPKLALPGVNETIQLNLAPRWILLTGGPRLGPAVLVWSTALAMLLGAFLLSRLRLAPLSTFAWLLLALGLTQAPLSACVFVAGFFLLFALRARYAEKLGGVHLYNLVQVALVAWALCAAAALIASIERGLLGDPEMELAGNGSTAQALRWFTDRAAPELTQAWVFSLPLWAWRLAMLAWALWLAASLLKWLPWAWKCFSQGGLYRRSPEEEKGFGFFRRKKPKAVVEARPVTTAPPA